MRLILPPRIEIWRHGGGVSIIAYGCNIYSD